MKRILVTGSAGFIGFHLTILLLKEGFEVLGYDGMTDYYDVELKNKRVQLLNNYSKYQHVTGMLENAEQLQSTAEAFQPQIIVHLAAQAGVRYSLENPDSYIQSNIIGTFNVMEVAKTLSVSHLLLASTSSVYGANLDMPFNERQKTETPLSLYAATKKATESLAHSYSHLHNIPTTVFRFFTVYGPYGRPDLALFKFVERILEGRPIDVYNYGEMYRDFTYVDDLVWAIRLLLDKKPELPSAPRALLEGDSLSPVAPYRTVNIGNSEKVKLTDFIDAIEVCLGRIASRNLMPMQTADVPATWANTELLEKLTGYKPSTNIKVGVKAFVDWYKSEYLN